MKKIIVIIMVVIMLVPVGWMALMDARPLEIQENRVRSERPALSKAYTAVLDNGEYAESFSAWFNDNYGLRDVFIRTKNQIKFSVFNIANGVYIGEEDYLVYHSTVTSQYECEKLDDDYFVTLAETIDGVKAMLEEKGTEFYIMFPPQKNTVFPERHENIPASRGETTRYDDLRAFLSERYPDNFADVLHILREAEEKAPTYFKTDFHWNNHGAAAAFSVMVNMMADEEIFTLDSYGIGSYDGFRGTQLNEFSILEDITETGYGAEYPIVSVMEDPSQSEIPIAQRHMVNPNEAPLGKLLIIGDSYSNYVTTYNPGISDCFSEVYYVNTNNNNYDGILQSLSEGQFDYVLFESIENSMPSYVEKLSRAMG